MSSAQEIILAQMCALAGQIDGVGTALATDGRSPELMAAEATRRRAAGATVFCRIQDGRRLEGPRTVSRTEQTLLFAIAVPALSGRSSCLTTAYSLWDALFRTAVNNDLGLDWLTQNLVWIDWALVYDTPTCAIVDLVMTCRFDLAAVPGLPTGSPLPLPRTSIAIQYSADGATWSSTYTDGDTYARWSVDGGSTYGDALRFRGADGAAGATVQTDDTITGDGSTEFPLSVANPGSGTGSIDGGAAASNYGGTTALDGGAAA